MIDTEVRFFCPPNLQAPKNPSLFDFPTGMNPPLGYPSDGGLADDTVIEDFDVSTQFSTFPSFPFPPEKRRFGSVDYLAYPHPDDAYPDRSRIPDPDVADPDSIQDSDRDAHAYPRYPGAENDLQHYLDASQFPPQSEFLGGGGDLHGLDDLAQSMELLDDSGDVLMDTSTLTLSSEGHTGGRGEARE